MAFPTLFSNCKSCVRILLVALYLFSTSHSDASESTSCTEAKKVYEKNRQELRSGYKLKRGNWLNCIEDQANEAKRKYCRLKKDNDTSFRNVQAEIEQSCLAKGIKRA